jgi:hypothetical protein
MALVLDRRGQDDYTVSFGQGVHPVMDPADIAAAATERREEMARRAGNPSPPDIVSITAVRTEDIPTVLPHLDRRRIRVAARSSGWLKAHGWFVGSKPPPGQSTPISGPDGYLRFDDATGEYVGMGISAEYVK